MEQPKKVIKGEIKYNVQLNEEQRAVKAGAYDKDISVIIGSWGTGKTLVACQIALDMLFKKHNGINQIFITRPIDFAATGYLKGSLSEKLAMHVMPIKQNLYSLYNKAKIEELFADGTIQIIPIDYMKGITALNAVMIVDEFEDINYRDFKLILTRLGRDSKLIFTGSLEQVDIPDSCIYRIEALKTCEFVNFHTLTANHRNENILKIINHIENNGQN